MVHVTDARRAVPSSRPRQPETTVVWMASPRPLTGWRPDRRRQGGVHRVAVLAKRWLLSTHQGSVDNAHLPSYLNEFCFRFNRRTARHRGLLFLRLLELAVTHDPVRRNALILGSEVPRKRPPVPAPKAISRHGLRFERHDETWQCSVVVDV
jgi:hypothetical protein